MLAVLAIAAGIASAGASAPAQDGGVISLMSDACVDTGMRRDAFETLARERGWQARRVTARSGDRPGWDLAFQGPGSLIMLTHVPEFAAGDPQSGSICTVSVERAPPGLEAQVAELAASLSLEGEAPVSDLPSGGAPMRTWSRFGDRTLTFATAPDGRAVLSLSRQIVTHEPAPVSPTGN